MVVASTRTNRSLSTTGTAAVGRSGSADSEVSDSELSASRQRHHAAGRHSGGVVTAAKGRNVVSAPR
jgi:hypothetical protein